MFGLYMTYLEGIKALTKSIGTDFETMAKETANKIHRILEKDLALAWNLSLSPDIIDVVEKSNLSYINESETGTRRRISDLTEQWKNAPEGDSIIKEVLSNKVSHT